MQFPTIRGLIDRRILVNYRVDPDVLAPLLPEPFRPKLVGGFGIVGICLIRLKAIRPKFLPAWLGLTSENAAHRMAVEWDDKGSVRQGVFVRRRETNSRLSVWAGGRLFSGLYNHAKFVVEEAGDRFHVAVRSDDGATQVSVRARRMDRWPATSVFGSVQGALDFFAAGSMGYSATPTAARFEGMQLHCERWHGDPLEIEDVQSSEFDNLAIFPRGSIELDSALLMRGIEHQWESQADMCCPARPCAVAASV